MQAQRQGGNLKTEIRILPSVLGRDPKFNFGRMTIAELIAMKKELVAERKMSNG